MVDERPPRTWLRLRWLLVLGLVGGLALVLAWLVGPLVSPQVAGRPVLLSRTSWAARHYLDAADGWLVAADQQGERLLQALGPLPGLDWPTPAGGWPESLYEQASLARGAAQELDRLARTARSYALPVDLLPAHEAVVVYLDSAAALAAGVLDYLGAPDEAKLPALVADWRAAQVQRPAATTTLARQRTALGWERAGSVVAAPGNRTPAPLPGPTRPGLFATHTPLVAATATATRSSPPTGTAAASLPVEGTPAATGTPMPTTTARPISPGTPGLFATHTPVR